jgi:prepilin-type N-terminal cleavage/methylation domain-containing protein
VKPTRSPAAMTLVEVIIAMAVLALACGGVFATLMQSRRLTEGSVVQNSALTIVQGYVEQIKNMELKDMLGGTLDAKGNPVLSAGNFSIPTKLDDLTPDPLVRCTAAIPAMSSLTPGTTPAGFTDNLKKYDILKDSTDIAMSDTSDTGFANTQQINWSTAWPGAQNYPSVATVGRNDLKMNLWVWITDLSAAGTAAQKVYGITVIYTWQYLDGGRAKYILGTVRAIRSSVPTF